MVWKFEQLRRLLGTAFCFLTFGAGGLVCGLVIFPLMFIVVRDPDVRRVNARRFIGKAFGAFASLMAVVGVVRYRIEGAEHIDAGRRQLIVANHPTLIDVVLLVSLFPMANCVVKDAVMRNPFMRSTVRAADYISNREPERLLDLCTRYVSAGGSLLLFPEGTRTRQGEELEFKSGAATVAVRSGAEILPIAIRCEPLFLSKQHPWYHVPAGVPTLWIRILPPRSINELAMSNGDERKRRNALNGAMLRVINEERDSMAFFAKSHYNCVHE